MRLLYAFFWGAFGGVVPQIVMLYKVVTGITAQALPTFSPIYFVVIVLFTLAAGFFTVAWKPENPLKAIWVGVSFPVIISAMLQAPP